jgi:uncharacterized protein YndB with AHSA1/START domain
MQYVMVTENSIEIEAEPSHVWAVFADVERWPGWTASIERITPLDGAGLEIGRRYEIKQPRFPKLVWEVTELDIPRSWTWEQRSLGGTTVATHELQPRDGGGTVVRQTIDQRGPLGVLVGALTRRLTRRYLDLEARGLKARCEA